MSSAHNCNNSAAACFVSQKEMRKLSVAQYPISEYFYLKIQFKEEGKVYITSSKSECFVFLSARVLYI